jgi:DNA-binding MarR family transcriptional regulator
MDLRATPEDNVVDLTLRLSRSQIYQAIGKAHPFMIDAEQMLRFAVETFDTRRRRKDTFPGVKFGEASWDILLHLYITTRSGISVDVSSLCLASDAPVTTAYRHIERLQAHGYVHREADPNDGRRTFIRADTKLMIAVEKWIRATASAVDPIEWHLKPETAGEDGPR